MQNLKLVLQRLSSTGLKVKLSKYEFLKSQIQFLGHVVDGQGIHTVKGKVKIVRNFPRSKKVDQFRSFLGLSGYYR